MDDLGRVCLGRKLTARQHPLVMLFFAPDCAESQEAARTLNALAVAYGGRLNFAAVNIDRDNELAKRYRVDSTPSLVILRNGQVLYQATGTLPARELRWMFEAARRHNADFTAVAEP